MESIVLLERGVCSCAELQVFSCNRSWKEVCVGGARDFNNIETRAVIKFFFPTRQGAEGNSRHSYRNIRGTCTIVCHRQKLGGDFSTCVAPSPGRSKAVTTPEIIDQIPELILEDRRISAKSIAENWTSHVSGLGPSFMKIWTCESSPRNGPQNAWTRIKNVKVASRLSKFWNFYGAIQVISCSDWWPWTKPGYITMTRRQSNNQWSGSIADHPTQKNSECKNPLENFSHRFFGIKTASSLLIIFQGAKRPTRSITHLCWCNWRTFWRKNGAGSSPRGSCTFTTKPRLTRHLQPRRNWLSWALNVFITHYILRFWPGRNTTFCLGGGRQLKCCNF